MVRAAALISAVWLLASPALAAGANAFDLHCTGSMRSISPALLRDTTEPYTIKYRIDLDAGKWCSDECKAPEAIFKVTPVAIVLYETNVDTPREYKATRMAISRETGKETGQFSFSVGGSRSSIFYDGQCEKAPFSGFPKTETLF